MRKLTSKETSGIVAAFGVGLAGAATTPNAEAAIIQLTVTPGSVPYGGSDHPHLGPASLYFHQDNTTFFGKAFYAHPSQNIAGFRLAPASQTITVNQNFTVSLQFPVSATGTATVGFKTTSNQVGWIRASFGGTLGPVVYLAAAYNDTPGGSIHSGSFADEVPEPTSLALAALSALALGSRSVRRLREKRKAS